MNHGPAIVAVLSEADRKFGRTTPYNKQQKVAYVQRRVKELAGQPAPTKEPDQADGDARLPSGDRE